MQARLIEAKNEISKKVEDDLANPFATSSSLIHIYQFQRLCIQIGYQNNGKL